MAETRKISAALTQRALRTITVGGALLASTALVGCSSILHPPLSAPAQPDVPPISIPAPRATPSGPPTGTVIMIIRHGEKPDEDVSPLPGINDQGQPDDSSLTSVGWDRARKLVDLFDPSRGDVKPGLARPKVIYAAKATDEGAGQRTRETVAPLAQKMGTPVNLNYGKGQEEQLVRDAMKQTGPVLISWQHGEIPAITEALGPITPTPPQEWPDQRFDMVWTLTKTDAGWNFAQVPEMVLPGDQVAPFTGDNSDGNPD
jgi:hypothetical protein